MATAKPCLAQLSRTCLYSLRQTPSTIPIRSFSSTAPCAGKASRKKAAKKESGSAKKSKKPTTEKRKKKTNPNWIEPDLNGEEQFSLLEAMRYSILHILWQNSADTSDRIIRAWEVGYKPTSVKYEIAMRLSGLRNGPVVRNRIRLPHPVKTDFGVCVICPPDSKYAAEARAAGAVLVGEEEVFDAVKEGKIIFERCLCQTDSLAKLNKSGIARILGPKSLMPNNKTGTIVADPAKAMKEMIGASEYRERQGVVRMAVGQLGFTPEQMSRNLKSFIESVKKDMSRLSDKISKNISEVVLSSTHGPGLPLNGGLTDGRTTVTEKDLS